MTARPGQTHILGRSRPVGSMLQGLVGFVVLLAFLEIVSRSGVVNQYYFPPVTQVLGGTGGLLVDLSFLGEIGNTVFVTVVGLCCASVIAIPLGVLLGSSRLFYESTSSLIELMRPVPAVALIPVAILALGTGGPMKIALIVFGAVWPILFNTIYGMRSVDPVAKDTARVFGCSEPEMLWRVSLPSSLPFIFTGIRIGAAVALILAISAGMLAGSQHGLGVWLLVAGRTGSPPYLVFAGTLLVGVLGWLINAALVLAGRRLLPWSKR